MKKYKWMIIGAGIFLLVIIASIFDGKKEVLTTIERPNYGEREGVDSLLVEYEGTISKVDIMVKPVELDLEQLDQAFGEVYEEIMSNILGENSSLNEIKSDLLFKTDNLMYGMKAEYYTDNYELINGFGEVNRKIKNNESCNIKVCIFYGDISRDYNISVVVVSGEQEENEQLGEALSELINVNSTVKKIQLPTEFDGKSIKFYKRKNSILSYVFLLAIIAGILMYYKKIYKPRVSREDSKKQMMHDYPEIVLKLTLLMGAGMSVYNALSKIAAESDGTSHVAYVELKNCMSRIASGSSETQAYREFGKKCGLLPYIKLSNLLVQNISMGTKNLFEILKEEASSAFVERKNTAKKIGEEAGTKLLLPMSLMLIVVLVIVIVPALFMSF